MGTMFLIGGRMGTIIFGANVNSVNVALSRNNSVNAKNNINNNLINDNDIVKLNQSDSSEYALERVDYAAPDEVSVGRTFGRPFKKMMSAMLPLIFQIGAASTWAVVAALVGVKTLLVTMVILKLLLVAGAAKAGALFASKGNHQPQGWEQPLQKEIHLHIHNNGATQSTTHEDHVSPSWSRTSLPDKDISMVINPYAGGPQTISTPFGNYVKIN
ncbi:hypothetical protein evm_001791 [Chilo suppressalis]|nr:hypothetical protein evm_001791 [Chilo suppressalis]